jgi:ClpP class serine protease
MKINKSLQNLLCTPMLLSQEESIKLEAFAMAEHDLEDEGFKMMAMSYEPRPVEELEYDAERGIGVINVTGMLIDKYDPFMSYFYGATSYEEILSDVDTLLEAGAHTIIQMNDSGGGQAYGLFATAESMRKKLDDAEAVMITYSDGVTASAAFGLAAVSDEIVSNPDSEVGSVGVVISLLDNSEAMKKEGYKRIFITAGKNKVPYDDDGKFTKEFLAELKEGVDETYSKFTSHISANRPVTEEQLIEVGAKVFSAKAAQEFGYIDKIMTREEFSNYFENITDGRGASMSILDKFNKQKLKAVKETPSMTDTTLSVEMLAEARASFEAEFAPKLTELQTELTKARLEFEATLSSKDAEVAELKASLEAFDKAKAEKSAQARLTQLSAIYGDVEGAKLNAKFESFSDEAFDEVVASLSGVASTKNEALEQEDGNEGVVVVAQPKTKEQAMAEHLATKHGDKATTPYTR